MGKSQRALKVLEFEFGTWIESEIGFGSLA